MLLEKLALFFAVEKKLRTILILIDERPEEITHFKQVTGLPVFSSSLDSSFESHTKLSGLLMKNIKQEIEAQNDVVVLIDSLTRLGRAHNLDDRRSGSRTLSGGLGARALEIPRKLFGMARNIEGGGSCTIIATILHNTGSRMDEHIFQEFKGTGNSEIMLSRQLAEKRLFPAVNIKESGTRREELMRPESDLNKLNIWRRHLLALEPDLAWQKLHAALMKYPDNNSLFKEL
jgi:transcription termination factor Rho